MKLVQKFRWVVEPQASATGNASAGEWMAEAAAKDAGQALIVSKQATYFRIQGAWWYE